MMAHLHSHAAGVLPHQIRQKHRQGWDYCGGCYAGHAADCPFLHDSGFFHPDAGHADIFCRCHDFSQPRVFGDGTDIAWPRDWSEQDARRWRAANGLLPESGS